MKIFKKKCVALFLFAFLCVSASAVLAGDPAIKIQTLPDQNSVKAGMMFLIHAQVANTSPDTAVEFWANTCSYEKHWVTDNPVVFIQSWTCDENTLEQITLQPGDVYEKNIILYIPKKDKTEPVTFRLGFKRMGEDGDVTEPLWGDPITMQVIVPEEMKEVAPAASENVPSANREPAASVEVNGTPQPSETESSEPVENVDAPSEDQEASAPGEVNKAPQPAEKEPAAMAAEGSLVFRDPAVPIKIKAGDAFSIALASNATTGFHWKMTLPEDVKAVTFLGSDYIVSQAGLVGAPGTEVFKFKAVTSGEIKAAFVYERPWETIPAPTRKMFTIVVQES